MQQHQIKLIDSAYTVKQAREVLFTLLNDKIRFLGVQILSIEERFGSNTEHMKTRIKELEAEKRQLKQQLDALQDDESLLDVDCHINIQVKETAGLQ